MATDTERGSVSRLSPLARPFTLKKPKNSSFALNPSLQDTSFSPSSSRLVQSFSSFSVEGDSFGYNPLDPSRGYQVSDDFGLMTESKSYVDALPVSDDFGLITESKSYLDALPVSQSTELGCKAHKSGDRQWSLHWKDKHSGLSMSNDDSVEQGYPTELKLRAETSDRLYRKFIAPLRKDDEVTPKSNRQIDTQHVSFSAVKSRPISSKFSTSSDLHSSAVVQGPQSGAPATSWSSNDSGFGSFERTFSQQLNVCAAKVNVSPSSDCNPLRAPVSVSSGVVTSYSPFNHDLKLNLDPDGHGGVSKNNICWYGLASLMEHRAVVDKSKEVFHDKAQTDKRTGKMSKPATQEVIEPLSMEKSELQITCSSNPIKLASKSLGVQESDPIGNSSEIINENDSDVDSPCWKGKFNASQSTCDVSRPDNFQHLKSAQDYCSNLNPLAPRFFPSSGKQKVNYCGTECEEDDCLTFRKTESSAVSLFSREQTLQKPATAGSSSSDPSSITETHCYDMHVPNKGCELLTNYSSSPMLSPSRLIQPSFLEDYFTSNCQLLTRQKVGGFGKVIEDAIPTVSASVALLASKHVSSSSSCKLGVSSALIETYGAVTKPLCARPKLDIQIVVKMMNELSELLMLNCANDLDSLNEHGHDIIKRIVYNLNVCIRNRVREHALKSESSHPHTSYCVMKSVDRNKQCSNLELQATRAKAVMVSDELGHQNKHEKQTSSTDFRERFLDSLNARNE